MYVADSRVEGISRSAFKIRSDTPYELQSRTVGSLQRGMLLASGCEWRPKKIPIPLPGRRFVLYSKKRTFH